jgi:predicted double-glycine peptidase
LAFKPILDSPYKKNFNNIITSETANSSQQMSNLAFHNLCNNANIPHGTRQLLGLNLKYCLACSQLNNNINTTVQKMAYAIRTTFPEPAPLHIEDKITSFEKILKTEQNNLIHKLNGRNLRNLTYPQSVTLRLLKQNNNLTVKPTDKNLGPAIIETKEYVSRILKEHLLTSDYGKLTEASAKNKN